MSLSGVFARMVALVGDATILWRRSQGGVHQQAVGATPTIPGGKAARQHAHAQDADGQGLGKRDRRRLRRPVSRSMRLPPASSIPAGSTCCPMATSPSPRPCSCRAPSVRLRLRHGQHDAPRRRRGRQPESDYVVARRERRRRRRNTGGVPRGTESAVRHALLGDTFYVGNTDGVVAFPYTSGATRITAPGRKLTAFKPADIGRAACCRAWMDENFSSASARSAISENAASTSRRAGPAFTNSILATGSSRVFASGLRNPVGLAWEPRSGRLWTVVNERDGLGDETPPDYLTSVRDGGFLRLALLLLGTDGGRPGTTGIPAAVAKAIRAGLTRWVDTRHRWACAGCQPERCQDFPRAWRSGSTAPGTAAHSADTGSYSCHSRMGARAGHRADILTGFSRTRRTSVFMDDRSASRSALTAPCWWRTT